MSSLNRTGKRDIVSSPNPEQPAPKRGIGQSLDNYFEITARGSSVMREFRGGLATFFAMAYIVVLNPLILSAPDGSGATLGIPQVAAVTAVVAGVMTIIMGAWAKYPFALAAGLGVNAFVSVTVATTPDLTWPEVMGLVVISGIIMFILVLSGLREAVMVAVPAGLKTAIVVGIGLFIAIIGLVNAGFVRRVPDAAHTSVPVMLGQNGKLLGWPTLIFALGLVLTIILVVRKVKGAILIGIVVSTIVAVGMQIFTNTASSQTDPSGWSLMVPVVPTEIFSVPDLSLFGKVDLFGAFIHLGFMSALLLTFTILLSVFFDAMGTMTGLASEAGLLDKDGNMKNANRVLLVDAGGSIAGGFGSVSANEIFVESGAGIAEGARTGLAAIFTGLLFLLAAFFAPLVAIVPFEAVAPALVVVGFMMASQVRHIDWSDYGIGFPAFLTFILMPFTYSIANGLGAGFIAYVIIHVAQGRAKEVHVLMWGVAAAFAIYFCMGPIQELLGVN
ncbi:NCS2 family permease [Arthrobacter sp. H35-D1]|uniref:NCS2 family permease n=1 Tax=Arthrobacter sp. H35-D1 TaxID=3046202 RepID=UPI0024B9F97B|nr:NCS2 family permease [Arthrobacter sp. H35-D1]MDJ0315440.1 NCS2 family permease [Arthrobacter sp. H35-D1]